MSTIRICDRCRQPVDGPIDATKLRTVVIPPESPSTQPVSDAAQCQIGVGSPNDLCDLCVVAALVELVLGRLGPGLTADMLASIGARAKAQLAPQGGR